MFFDDVISVLGVRSGRNIAATLSACVFDDGVADPLATVDTATECDNISAFFKSDDWPEVSPPQLGDVVVLDDERRYSVRRVGHLADCYCLTCRAV